MKTVLLIKVMKELKITTMDINVNNTTIKMYID